MTDLIQDPSRFPAAPTPPREAPEAERYRPLSLLALIGFLMALVFAGIVVLGGVAEFARRYSRIFLLLGVVAVVVGLLVALSRKKRSLGSVAGSVALALAALVTLLGLGGLVAFSGTTPWLLPDVIWLLVVAALLTCWLALSRIAASEGTLGGVSLARWGLGLSLFFGLNYAAYLASNTFAVRSQAQQAADEFLDSIKKGELDRAFLLGLPARSRPTSGSDLRRTLEMAYNELTPGGEGPYSSFQHNRFVRMVQMAGPDATYEHTGFTSEFDRGAYQISVSYKVQGALGSFDLTIAVKGEQSTEGGAVRRQWHVELSRSGISQTAQIASMLDTDEGQGVLRVLPPTHELARDWLTYLSERRFDEAYLATLDPKERQRQASAEVFSQPSMLALTGVGLVGGLGSSKEAAEQFRKGKKAFQEGSILDLTDLFPPSGQKREMTITFVKKLFAGKVTGESRNELTQVELPLYRRAGDEVTVTFPVQLKTKENDNPRIISADLEIVGPASEDRLPPSAYRVRVLRVLRGQEVPDMKPKR